MSITTFSTLKTAVSNYLKGRNDIDDRIDEFIALGETRVNRKLRVPEMISTATVVAAASVSLPADFLSMETAELQSDPTVPLSAIGRRAAQKEYRDGTTGRPCSYRVQGGSTMLLFPTPDESTNITLEYYAKPAALVLTTQETNTIMPAHHDVLLYAAMCEAMLYIMDDARVALWEGRLERAIEEANAAGSRTDRKGTKLQPAYGSGS